MGSCLNEILSDIKGRDNKVNPRAIMVDEIGANYCAIQKVFGLDFVTSKVVSCQVHYNNDVNRVSFRISPSYRDLFKSICHRMCSVATMAEYNEKKKWLDEIANIFPDISWWLTWWDARSVTCFLLLDALATQMSHWPRVVILCSSATCNFGIWRLHGMTNLQCSHKFMNLIIPNPVHFFKWQRTILPNSLQGK